MADQTDSFTVVQAALDLAGKATPGPWSVDRWEIAGADGRECARVVLTYDAPAIAALRNAAPAIADLCREVERLRATVSVLDLKVVDAEQSHMAAIATERRRREAVEIERDGAALDRRRHFASYTREHEINATLTTRIAALEAELVQARAAAPITDDLHPDGCHTTATTAFRDCSGDGHHECRICTRFDEDERAKRIGEF